MASMSDKVGAFLRREVIEDLSDFAPEGTTVRSAALCRGVLSLENMRSIGLRSDLLTCPVSSDHGQLETGPSAAGFGCPLRDGEATGRGAKPRASAAPRPVAVAGAAVCCASVAAKAAGVK